MQAITQAEIDKAGERIAERVSRNVEAILLPTDERLVIGVDPARPGRDVCVVVKVRGSEIVEVVTL